MRRQVLDRQRLELEDDVRIGQRLPGERLVRRRARALTPSGTSARPDERPGRSGPRPGAQLELRAGASDRRRP